MREQTAVVSPPASASERGQGRGQARADQEPTDTEQLAHGELLTSEAKTRGVEESGGAASASRAAPEPAPQPLLEQLIQQRRREKAELEASIGALTLHISSPPPPPPRTPPLPVSPAAVDPKGLSNSSPSRNGYGVLGAGAAAVGVAGGSGDAGGIKKLPPIQYQESDKEAIRGKDSRQRPWTSYALLIP